MESPSDSDSERSEYEDDPELLVNRFPFPHFDDGGATGRLKQVGTLEDVGYDGPSTDKQRLIYSYLVPSELFNREAPLRPSDGASASYLTGLIAWFGRGEEKKRLDAVMAKWEHDWLERILDHSIGVQRHTGDIIVANFFHEHAQWHRAWDNAFEELRSVNDGVPFFSEQQKKAMAFDAIVEGARIESSRNVISHDLGHKYARRTYGMDELLGTVLRREGAGRLKPFYVLKSNDLAERLVRRLFEELWKRVERWLVALADVTSEQSGGAIDATAHKKLLETHRNGRFFFAEMLHAQNVEAFTSTAYADQNVPAAIAFRVRATLSPGSPLRSTEALFCLFLHEVSHLLDPGEVLRDNSHDRTFGRTLAFVVQLAVNAGVLASPVKWQGVSPPDDYRFAQPVPKTEMWSQTTARAILMPREPKRQRPGMEDDEDKEDEQPPPPKQARFKALPKWALV